MKKLNIVYAYMRESRYEISLPAHDAVVVWTTTEEPDADIVVYHNGYSYNSKNAAANPGAYRILYIYEPLVVYPRQFMSSFFKSFDVVLTWCETLVEQGMPFVQFPSLYYGFPFGAEHGVTGRPELPENWSTKKKSICQVAGNKFSFVTSELYSKRRQIARWFAKDGRMELDTFGIPPMPVPRYQGKADNKLETMSRYRFALCLENDHHPLWSRGYVTEKIFDCFHAFAVPIYWGAADVEKHIPPECFIDFRNFSSLKELDLFLSNMTDETYLAYLRAIETFLKSYDAQSKHSCEQLYTKVLDLEKVRHDSVVVVETEPFGFWEKAGWLARIRCWVMMCAVPVYKFVRGTRYAGT
jgi:hypothetical protein